MLLPFIEKRFYKKQKPVRWIISPILQVDKLKVNKSSLVFSNESGILHCGGLSRLGTFQQPSPAITTQVTVTTQTEPTQWISEASWKDGIA